MEKSIFLVSGVQILKFKIKWYWNYYKDDIDQCISSFFISFILYYNLLWKLNIIK